MNGFAGKDCNIFDTGRCYTNRMVETIFTALGGLGLFLFGMHTLTTGLKGLAGKALRRWLASATGSPVSGAITGALSTALVQSSSATTLAAVSFVGAGVLTFAQALGIIFGANIGTTITGWMVALLGFKLDLGTLLMPGILIGAFLVLLTRGRAALAGKALAGFAMLFAGIAAMKAGMAPFQGHVTPSDFPGDDFIGRIELVGIGVLITLITQSSSAGVTSAMVALSAGAINFPQAAALVIGMDVGTTVTAAMATVGGSTAMRRTGLSHVIYNCMTGVMAFLLLDIYTSGYQALFNSDPVENAEIAVALFHTFFNSLGVLLVLPFTHQFAQFITRVVPASGPPLAGMLDQALLAQPASALMAADTAERKIAHALMTHLHTQLDLSVEKTSDKNLRYIDHALQQTQQFIADIPTALDNTDQQAQAESLLHRLDHLKRLHERLQDGEAIRILTKEPILHGLLDQMVTLLADLEPVRLDARNSKSVHEVEAKLKALESEMRTVLISATASGKLTQEQALSGLSGVRWIARVAHHLWRIGVHAP